MQAGSQGRDPNGNEQLESNQSQGAPEGYQDPLADTGTGKAFIWHQHRLREGWTPLREKQELRAKKEKTINYSQSTPWQPP